MAFKLGIEPFLGSQELVKMMKQSGCTFLNAEPKQGNMGTIACTWIPSCISLTEFFGKVLKLRFGMRHDPSVLIAWETLPLWRPCGGWMKHSFESLTQLFGSKITRFGRQVDHGLDKWVDAEETQYYYRNLLAISRSFRHFQVPLDLSSHIQVKPITKQT